MNTKTEPEGSVFDSVSNEILSSATRAELLGNQRFSQPSSTGEDIPLPTPLLFERWS